MPLNHQDATASVHVLGLSLGCLNRNTKKWEVCFLRERTHKLRLKITKHTAGGVEIIDEKEIRGHRIIIEAYKPVTSSTSLFNPKAKESDSERFAKLVDVEKLVYRNKRIKLKRPTCGLTEMYVSGATLYSVADGLSTSRVKLVRTDQYEKPLSLGRVGTTAGADIKCRTGGAVVIKVEGTGGFERRLNHETGTHYKIVLDNMCPPGSASPKAARGRTSATHALLISKLSPKGGRVLPHSDFTIYYEMIKPPTGKGYYDIQKETGRGPGAVCNYSHLGMTAVMFPLPIVDV